jgi:hypothetical protein
MTRKTTDRVFALVALILIGAVWLTSAVRTRSDLIPIVRQTVPGAGHIVRLADGSYVAWTDITEKELLARSHPETLVGTAQFSIQKRAIFLQGQGR